jgi:hypothetical protein
VTDGAQSEDAQARIAELENQLEQARVQFADAHVHIAELDAELKNERAQFALAERAVGVGYWRLTVPDYRITWSPGMRAMFGMDPTTSMSSDGIPITEADIDQHHFFQNKIKIAVATRSFLPYRRWFRTVLRHIWRRRNWPGRGSDRHCRRLPRCDSKSFDRSRTQ